MDIRTLIRWLLNPWVIGAALILGLLLLGATLGLMWYTRPGPQPPAGSTAIMQVVRAPTATPIPPTLTPTPDVTPTPSVQVPPAPEPGVIGVGAYVQISGTGGDGLRLRASPGLKSEVRLLGAEAEVFQVSEGPQEADGYTWWYLKGPYDPARQGWAVANFLTAVQGP